MITSNIPTGSLHAHSAYRLLKLRPGSRVITSRIPSGSLKTARHPQTKINPKHWNASFGDDKSFFAVQALWVVTPPLPKCPVLITGFSIQVAT